MTYIAIDYNEKENLVGVDLDEATIDEKGLHGIKVHLKWTSRQDSDDPDPIAMTAILDLDGVSLKRSLGRLASGFVIQRQSQERLVSKAAARKWIGKEIHWSQFTTKIEDPEVVAKRITEAVDSQTIEKQRELYEQLKAKFEASNS